jgi:hypothetical protein
MQQQIYTTEFSEVYSWIQNLVMQIMASFQEVTIFN